MTSHLVGFDVALSNNTVFSGTKTGDLIMNNFTSNTGVVFGSSNVLLSATRSNAVFKSQYFGIGGKSNPTYPLDVLGDINITGELRKNGSILKLSQWINGTSSNIYIMGSNVGIGKSNPGFSLDVAGTANFESIYVNNEPIQIADGGLSNIAYSTSNFTSNLVPLIGDSTIDFLNAEYVIATTAFKYQNVALSNLYAPSNMTSSILSTSNYIYTASNTVNKSILTNIAASNRAFESLRLNGGTLTGTLSAPNIDANILQINGSNLDALFTPIGASNVAHAALPKSGGVINGELTISGNLLVSGTTTNIDTTALLVEDSIITVNSTLTGTPGTDVISGIEIERGDASNYYFVYQESSGLFKIGLSNDLQTVTTRDDALTTGFPYYDAVQSKLVNRNIVQGDIGGLNGQINALSNVTFSLSNVAFVNSGNQGGALSNVLVNSNNELQMPQAASWNLIRPRATHFPVQAMAIDSYGGNDQAISVSLDASSNIFVAGVYNSGINTSNAVPTIYNSNGVASSVVLPNMTQSSAAFVVKYNTAGVAQFDVGIDGVGSDTATCVATDTTGAFVVGGTYSGARAPLVYNSNAYASTIPALPTPSNSGAFVVKYNASGAGVWSAGIDSASIDSTNGVAIDTTNSIILAGTISGSNGKVYETVNTDVVKTSDVSVNAMVTSFVGNGSSGAGGGGIGLSASLGRARCIDVDSAGNIYYTEDENHVVTRVTPGGLVTTFAGGRGITGTVDGVGTNARFSTPFGIAIDRVRNVAYVSDRTAHRIRRIDLATREVSVFAGTGIQGATNGTGTNASFNEPLGLGVDSLGNVYVADVVNSRIRRIDIATRAVTTFAGSGTSTYLNGTGTNAGLQNPVEIRFDSSDNAFVTEIGGHRVRRITPAGNVTLLAGSTTGATGDADGTGAAATFRSPWGIVIDKDNNVYVSEETGHRIRRITSSGVVTTLVGTNSTGNVNAPGTIARFNAPQGMFVDAFNNNLVVVDRNNGLLRRVELGSPMSSVAYGVGGWQNAYDSAGNLYITPGADSIVKITPQGVQSSITVPGASGIRGLTIDSNDNIYTGGYDNGVIHKITPEGVISTFATAASGTVHGLACDTAGNVYAAAWTNVLKISPTGVVSNLTSQTFDRAFGIDVDANGLVYLVAAYQHNIYKITQTGTVTLFAGTGATGSTDGLGSNASFNIPRSCKLDRYGNLYVGENNGARVRKIYPNGRVTTIWVATQALYGIAFDRDGHLMVSAPDPSLTYQVRHPHIVTTLAGNGTSGAVDAFGTNARFRDPIGTVVDSLGNIYVAEANNHVIRKITASGNVTTFVGSLGAAGFSDASGTNARFNRPRFITIDSSNNLYVSDNFNRRIRKITSDGNVTTFAGSGVTGYADGIGTLASFTNLEGIAIDNSNNIYVVDRTQRAIRKITPDGNVTTFAGSTNGVSATVDALGTNARFAEPIGLASDVDGNLYVADYGGNRIRKVNPSGNVTTFIGNGTNSSVDGLGTNATTSGPHGIAADKYNNVYVGELGSSSLRMIYPSGYVRRLVGNGTVNVLNGLGTNTNFNDLSGLCVDLDGNIIIADQPRHMIRKASTMRNYAYEAAVMASSNAVVPSGITTGAGMAVKYNSNGEALWAVTVDGTSVNDSVTAVTIDGSAGGANAVYMAGRYGPTNANIFTGSNVVGGISLPVASGMAAYGMRLTSNGTPQWVVRIDGTGAEQTLACTSDTSGNFYMAGSYSNSIAPVVYNSNNVIANEISLPNTSNVAAFVIKYNSNGIAQWARTIDGISQPEIAYSVTTDANLNVYVAGSYATGSNTYPIIYGSNNVRSPILLPMTSNNNTGGFVVKYDSNGLPIDAWTAVGASNCAIYGITTNPSSSNLVVAGMYKGGVTLYDGTMSGSTVGLPSLATQSAFVTRYLPQYTSNFKLMNNTVNETNLKIGAKYYITNESTSNVQVSITDSNMTTIRTYPIAANSSAVLQWYNDWYRFA